MKPGLETICALSLLCLVGCGDDSTRNARDSGTVDSSLDAGVAVDSGPRCTVDPTTGCDVPTDTCSTNTCDSVVLQCVREVQPDHVACSVVLSSAEGVCANGECCTGCLVDSSCKSGTLAPWCGSAGSSCEPCCAEPGCTCESGHCAPLMEFAGTAHACSLSGSTALHCWGNNARGQLGINSIMSQSSAVLVSLTDVIKIAPGEEHTCALRRSGEVYCWGKNLVGQAGVGGTTDDQRTPQKVNGLGTAMDVATGVEHSCAVLQTGQVYCWGANNWGQLGTQATDTYSATPIAVNGVADAVAVTCGQDHTCALRSTGTIVCWGNNDRGELGDGTMDSRTTPGEVLSVANAIQVSAGSSFTCALTSAGEVWCWGGNTVGQLGHGVGAMTSNPVPTAVDVNHVVRISSGKVHVCVLASSPNQVFCWGSNTSFKLGTTEGATSTPLAVAGITNPVSITAGGTFSCAREASGTRTCWGTNSSGQLGNAMTSSPSATPVPVVYPPE